MKNFKSTEAEVGKKDKKLKDVENSKSAANQRSAIDTLSRQLQEERKVTCSPPHYCCVLVTFMFLVHRRSAACERMLFKSGRGVRRSTKRGPRQRS